MPDFRAAMAPLSARVEKARTQPTYAVKEVEEAYRPLAVALDKTFQNLRAAGSRLDLDGLLAAKPKTATGDAAGALTAEITAALGTKADPARLAAVNSRLAGYLRSGNPDDLTRAMGEMDLLFDAAGVKDKNLRADLFDRVGREAQKLAAQTPAAERPAGSAGTGAEAVVTSGGVRKETDLQSMRRLDAVRLDVEDPAQAPGFGATLSGWVTTVAGNLRSAGGTWADKAAALRGQATKEADAAAEAERIRAAAAAEISARKREQSIAAARLLTEKARRERFAPDSDPEKGWPDLDPSKPGSGRAGLRMRETFLYPELNDADRAAASAAWDEAQAAWSGSVAAMYEAVTTEVTAVIRHTREAEGKAATEAAKRYLRAVAALFGEGGAGGGQWEKLEAFWSASGEAASPEAKAARGKAAEAVALLRALIAAQTPPTAISSELRAKMIDADGKILPFGQAVVASHGAKLEKARKMGQFLASLSETLAAGKSDAETAAALKAAFDGNRDLLSGGEDIAVLAAGLLEPPPQGDPKALEAFTAKRRALASAVDVLRSADAGADAPLARGFAQYNAFLYAHLLGVPADGPDGLALAEPGLAAKKDAFLAAYRDGSGGLSDEPPRLGQVSLARLAREIAEKLPSLKAKRDAASAGAEFLAALDKLSPERRDALIEERDKLAKDAALVAGVVRRAEAMRATGERIAELLLRRDKGENVAVALAAAEAEQRRHYAGDGGPDAVSALAAYRVAGAPDGDWAGIRAEIDRGLAAKRGSCSRSTGRARTSRRR
ncbi:MAG: hypothetical protein M0D55_17160 [Elusimicrobiota bacterium]|nr:MAG: hypothetical protein M0D55_17160 [Elusimicrobiota bacterium]